MILIERINPSAKSSSSTIHLVSKESDERLLGTVIAVADAASPTDPISKIQVGDVVLVSDAWGVGPKSIESGDRKFSFHKISNVIGVVRDK